MKKQQLYNATILILCLLILCTLVAIVVVLARDTDEDVAPITTTDKVMANTTPVTTPGVIPGTTEVITSITTTSALPITTVKDPVTQPVVTTPSVTTTQAPVVTTIPKTPTDEYRYKFTADLSMYEQYMNPMGDLWDDAYLLLVNTKRPLTKDQELTYEFLKEPVKVETSTKFTKYPYLKTNGVALMALEAMAIELEAYGIKGLDIQSAYRDYATQEIIFERNVSNTKKYVCDVCEHVFIGKTSYTKCEKCDGSVTRVSITRDEAVKQVQTYSCMQGTSEHQSTLVFDVIVRGYASKYTLEQIFGDTEAGKWLAENCYKFGFILRFPEDKEDITGIIYEPWHFRYVGRYHASRMHDLGMCLEEYIEYLEENEYFEKS